MYEFIVATAVFVLLAIVVLACLQKNNLQDKPCRLVVYPGLLLLAFFYFHNSDWFDSEGAVRLHEHDFYHYYFGAKYYPELGHNELYHCTWVAFEELRAENKVVPEISLVRSLAQPERIRYRHELAEIKAGCMGLFERDRWLAFRDDLLVYLGVTGPEGWQDILTDLGNNSPPSWNLLATLPLSVLPLTPGSMVVFNMLDLVVWLILIPWLIHRYYGEKVMVLYLLAYFANPLAMLAWNGGSYFRSPWLLTLVWGIAALHRQRFVSAGILLGLSTGFRVFPLFFAAGAMVSLVRRYHEDRMRLFRFLLAFMLTLISIFLLSLMVFGIAAWVEFFEVVSHRLNPLSSNAVSFLKMVTLYNVSVVPADPTLAQFHDWLRLTRYDYTQYSGYAWLVKSVLILSVLYIGYRSKADAAALIVGVTSVYLLLSPFTYYYSFLALVPVVAFSWPSARLWILVNFLLALVVLRLWSVPMQVELLQDSSYFSSSYHASIILLIMLVVQAIILLPVVQASGKRALAAEKESVNAHGAGGDSINPARVGSGILLGLLLLTLYVYRPQPAGHQDYRELQDFVLASAGGNPVVLRKQATGSWHGSDFLEVRMKKGDWLEIDLDVASGKPGDLMVYHTLGDIYSGFAASISGRNISIQPPSNTSIMAPSILLMRHVVIGPGDRLLLKPLGDKPVNVLAIDGIGIAE